MLKRILLPLAAVFTVLAVSFAVQADPENGPQHKPAMQHMHTPHPEGMLMKDNRTLVHFPAMLRINTLAHMRDHLLSLDEIQLALANKEFDKASSIAEQRLGMSSLKLHDASVLAKYMPKGMRELGTAMHRNASRFAIVANNAAVSGDVKPALIALSRVTQSCVACHSSYRLQ